MITLVNQEFFVSCFSFEKINWKLTNQCNALNEKWTTSINFLREWKFHWERSLELMPLEIQECKTIFCDMLVWCKITKFLEIKYKILTRILATPTVLSSIHKDPVLNVCSFCGMRVNIDHILLYCPYTTNLHRIIMDKMGLVNQLTWIFGGAGKKWDLVIWVYNFAIYKAHLMCSHGKSATPENQFVNEYFWFASVFSELKSFCCLDDNNTLSCIVDGWLDRYTTGP